MSNGRNELFQLILGRTTTKAVERILAAGYRKRRTIQTLAELDALPLGSVVRNAEGYVCEIDEWPVINAHEMFKGYIVTGEPEDWPLDRLKLPATVLWEPQS